MKRMLKIYIFGLILLVLGANTAAAKGIYDGCIFGFQFGQFENFKPVTVPATTGGCGIACRNECRSIFLGQAILASGETDGELIDRAISINPDVYYSCLQNCRGGNSSASYFPRQIVNNDPANPIYEYRGPVYIGYSCPANSQFQPEMLNGPNRKKYIDDPRNNTNSGFSVSKGDDVSVTFISSPSQRVNLCGSEGFFAEPMMRAINHTEWPRNTSQNQIASKQQHICTYTSYVAPNIADPNALPELINNEIVYPKEPGYLKFSQNYSNLTNLDLWAGLVNPNSVCSWQMRNRNFVNTGMYAKDGDEVVLMWSGNVATKIHSNNKSMDRDFLFSALRGDTITAAERSEYEDLYKVSSTLEMKNPNDPITAVSSIKFIGEEARVGGFDGIGKFHTCPEKKDANSTLGLLGCVTDRNITYVTKQNDAKCFPKENADRNFKHCKLPADSGNPLYIYSGELEGYSQTESEIALRHPENAVDDPSDNSGGYEINATRFGCPFRDGERLEYTIFNVDSDVKNKGRDNEYVEVEWKPLTEDMLFDTKPIKADKNGTLYFRVKPLDAPSLDPTNATNAKIMANYGQRGLDGSYQLSLFKMDDSGFLNPDGPLRKIVQTVIRTLFGGEFTTVERLQYQPYYPSTPNNVKREMRIEFAIPQKGSDADISETWVITTTTTIKGAVRTIYEEVIQGNQFIEIIRAILVFYFAFLGIGFILGVIQTSQTELVVRVTKVAFVLALISDTSWDFFSSGFFNAFIYGGIELMSYIATGGLGQVLPITPEEVQKDPSIIFSMFDGLLVQIFSANIWIKTFTYMISGLMGLFIGCLVIISLLNYAITVIKVFLIYLMALVMTATLIITAPIFIPMVLFKFTKAFFDSWWKMLLSYTIQPVAIMAAISIFNVLIAIAIYATLSYTVCPVCYFKFAIPGAVDICLMPWYQMAYTAHLPEGATQIDLPAGMLTSAIVLMILTGSCYAFVEYIARVVGMIIDINTTMMGGTVAGGPGGNHWDNAQNMAKGATRKASAFTAGNIGRMGGHAVSGFKAAGGARLGGELKHAAGKASGMAQKAGGAVASKVNKGAGKLGAG